VLTASAAPSISSVYAARQDLRDCLFLAISQSGRSPDLLESARRAQTAGARVVALVNVEDSPLARLADHLFALDAGPERSVAASKSFIASLSAVLQLIAAWTDDSDLLAALDDLPDALARAWALDWSAAVGCLASVDNLFVIGRGLGLAVAQEAALKGKETCGMHAEAFSGAEVRHGPQALLGPAFPALLLIQDDETRAGMLELARDLVARQVRVLTAGATIDGAVPLPTANAHPVLQPVLLIQSFYRMVDALAHARGRDPDQPPHLRKVTETR
jgi:glucosamine--fructose-6-phosphate aminotransferase (isomerizing)